jgi:hypothetical protein
VNFFLLFFVVVMLPHVVTYYSNTRLLANRLTHQTRLWSRIHLLTPWSRVLLEKLTGSQLVKNSPHVVQPEGTLPRLQVPATCRYPEPDQSIPYSHPTFSKSILVLSSHLRLKLPSGLFPSGNYGSLATGIETGKRRNWFKKDLVL